MRGLSYQCALPYLGDIIVFYESFKYHLGDLRFVFGHLRPKT